MHGIHKQHILIVDVQVAQTGECQMFEENSDKLSETASYASFRADYVRDPSLWKASGMLQDYLKIASQCDITFRRS